MLLYFLNKQLTFHNFSKHNMLTIESRQRSKSDEKLWVICIGSLIRHTQHVGLIMFQFEIFVFECGSIYWFSSCSVIFLKISALGDKTFNDSMKNWSTIAESFSMSGKLSKILTCFGCYFIEQFYLDPSYRFLIDCYVEIYIRFFFTIGWSHIK